MLNDKDMALDALDMAKHGATELTKAALESSDPALKRSFLQMRSQCEAAQQQLAQMATNNNWYLPAAPADHQELNRVLRFFQNNAAVPNAPPKPDPGQLRM